jgi:hypothetical protein
MKPILMLAGCGTAAALLVCLLMIVHTRGQSDASAAQPSAGPDPTLTNGTPQALAMAPYRLNLQTWVRP